MILLMFLVLFLAGCGVTHHPALFCTLVKIDGEPAIGCVDASTVEYETIEPYESGPSAEKHFLGPYWKYDGYDKDKEQTSK